MKKLWSRKLSTFRIVTGFHGQKQWGWLSHDFSTMLVTESSRSPGFMRPPCSNQICLQFLAKLLEKNLHSLELTWKWRMAPWKTIFHDKQVVFHFQECKKTLGGPRVHATQPPSHRSNPGNIRCVQHSLKSHFSYARTGRNI